MGNTNNDSFGLNDEVIGQIAKLVQLAIITGTDIVDNLRMMRVTLDKEAGVLTLSDDYRETAALQISKLMQEVEAFQPESE